MPATILTVTTTPSSFTSGNFPLTTFNSGPSYGFTWTPGVASTSGQFGGFEAFLATNDDGGLWQNNRRVELYNGSGGGTLVAQSAVLAWGTGSAIRIVISLAAGANASSMTISGATSGNGTTTFTTSGTYFTASTLGVGQFTGGNTFILAGSMSSIDDAVQGGTATGPAVAWTAAAHGLRAATAAPSAIAWTSAATGAKNGLFGTATGPAVVWTATAGGLRARLQAATPAAVTWSSGASGAKDGTLALGAHSFDFQRFGFANRPWSIALNTQVSGSIVLVGSGGKSSDVGSTWTDSKNAAGFRKLTAVVDYPDFAGYGTQLGVTPNPMVGGTAQTFSGPVTSNDENTTFATEAIGAARAKTINTNVANSGGSGTVTSGTITTDGPALLVADWWGSSPVVPPFTGGVGTPYTAVPNNGFTVIDSYLVNNEFGEVQAARAVKLVTSAGSYNVTWTHTPNQGAQTWLTALEPARSGAGTPSAVHWSASPIGARTLISAATAPTVSWTATVAGGRTRIGAVSATAIAWTTSGTTGLLARLSGASAQVVTWSGAALGQRQAIASGPSVAWSAPSVTGTKARTDSAVGPVVAWSASPRGLRLAPAEASAIPWSASIVGLRGLVGVLVADPVIWTGSPAGTKSSIGDHPAIAQSIAWSAVVAGLRSMVRAAAAPVVRWRSGASGVASNADPFGPIEDAIYRWVVAGSGLAPEQVIWATVGGGGPQPTGLYISMRLIDIDSVSDDWLITRNEGGVIVNHVRGTRHPTLELRCYAGASYGPRRAELVLARVLASASLPSVTKLLRDGDVGIGPTGKVRVIPGSRSTMFDPLAVVEVGLHITIDVAETGTTIETVETDMTELTPPGPVLVVANPET